MCTNHRTLHRGYFKLFYCLKIEDLKGSIDHRMMIFTLIWKVAKCPNCKREFSLDWLCKGKPGGCGGTREYVLTNCIVIPLLRPAYQPHNDKYWHRQWRGHQVTPVTAEDTKRRQALTSLWTLVIIIRCFFSCKSNSRTSRPLSVNYIKSV